MELNSMRAVPRVLCSLWLAVMLLCLIGGARAAQPIVRDLPPGLQIPAAAQPGPGFDVDNATEAYLALLSPQQRQRSDEYFEGGYWLKLWEVLWTVSACMGLLLTGVSNRISQWSQRLSRRSWISTPTFIALFLGALFLLDLPLTVYTDYLREREYGLSEQPFGAWMRDQMIVLAANVVIFTVALSITYAAVRRTGARWWIWATGLTWATLMTVQLILPAYILPLLNNYKELPDGLAKTALLPLARANQVPTDHIQWYDASKQDTRRSANVAGLLGTTRIALSDNLLNKSSLPEIKAVLGHEMGHYVLNHLWKEPILLTMVVGLTMALLGLTIDGVLLRWGGRLGLADRADRRALPLAIALFSVIFFLLTPLQNLVSRSFESEADAFGINAAREPYGWAMAAMRLSTFRKLRPGALEEFMFYDHPSGYERVHAAMTWLKENQGFFAASPLDPAISSSSVDVSPEPLGENNAF